MITKIIGMVMITMMLMLCLSCATSKCMVERTKCKWDCPSTVGLKEICEQKCNVLYDLCRSQD
jgi:hypothetical protein